jgi:hypothetical protein
MTNETQIVELPIESLIKADWNYKTEGTPEQIAKLAESIRHDKSAGVIAVREMPEGKFEVIDGNHRLDAILQVGWTKVPCENFGSITIAQAVIIARRRNHKWFEDDTLKYAELFRDKVLPEISIEELEKFMPDTKEEMESLSKLLDFDWSQFKKKSDEQGTGDGFDSEIKLKVSKETFEIWQKWLQRVKEVFEYDTPSKAFEIAIAEAMNIPVESLK